MVVQTSLWFTNYNNESRIAND